MIIKKNKNKNKAPLEDINKQDNVANEDIFAEELGTQDVDNETKNSELFSIITEREERRRGDRRRSYRRIDDRSLVSKAKEEANTIRQSAEKDGFEAGLGNAREEIEKLRTSIESFLNAKEEALESIIDDISSIAIKVAENIIKTEVACDETIVLNIIKEVLKEIDKNENRIIIKTNPSDTELVQEKLPQVFPSNKVKAKIEVTDDEAVDLGSCIVQTQNGIIDATFSTQLNILQQVFEANL